MRVEVGVAGRRRGRGVAGDLRGAGVVGCGWVGAGRMAFDGWTLEFSSVVRNTLLAYDDPVRLGGAR